MLKLHKNQASRLILQSPCRHNEATVSIVRMWQVGDATCQKIASLVWHQKQAVEASTQKIANACSWMPCFLLCNLAGTLGPLVIRLLVPSPSSTSQTACGVSARSATISSHPEINQQYTDVDMLTAIGASNAKPVHRSNAVTLILSETY